MVIFLVFSSSSEERQSETMAFTPPHSPAYHAEKCVGSMAVTKPYSLNRTFSWPCCQK